LVHELRDTLEDLEEVYDMRNVATYIGIELNPIDMKRKKKYNQTDGLQAASHNNTPTNIADW
jgi:hypothetical protein